MKKLTEQLDDIVEGSSIDEGLSGPAKTLSKTYQKRLRGAISGIEHAELEVKYLKSLIKQTLKTVSTSDSRYLTKALVYLDEINFSKNSANKISEVMKDALSALNSVPFSSLGD